MTEAERIAIVEVIATADGNCNTCVRNLAAVLKRRFPDEAWEEAARKAEFVEFGRPTRALEAVLRGLQD